MGEHIAPSPQKGRGRKNKKTPRRKKAAPMAANGQPASANGASRSAVRLAPNGDSRQERGGESKAENSANAARPNAQSARRSWFERTAYAALDLGTNNCRLLIAKAGGDDFTVVDAFSRVVRLGEGLTSTGRMSDEAMDRAVEALSVCADKLKKRNVVLARSVATEACRQAVNGAQFIERVKRETGIHLDIISPKEEARLAVMGCHALLEAGEGPALIFDIGGGSTELVLVSTNGVVPEIIDWVSVPWGVVSLTESERQDAEDAESLADTYKAMRDKVSASFTEFAARLPKDGGDHRLLGTSGTVTTLASVYLKLPSYDRRAVDGLHLPTEKMREISRELARRSIKGRAEFPTIGHERADLVVAGCAILESIFDIWPGERLGVADRGIREGILRALMASDAKRRNRRN
ncbi:Ppx/GppA phosphatase family protein [Sphingorhabdus profundilacus]|nr:Ppx/GppA phosphatase family protein [Sphingorhabdus profundilacus]